MKYPTHPRGRSPTPSGGAIPAFRTGNTGQRSWRHMKASDAASVGATPARDGMEYVRLDRGPTNIGHLDVVAQATVMKGHRVGPRDEITFSRADQELAGRPENRTGQNISMSAVVCHWSCRILMLRARETPRLRGACSVCGRNRTSNQEGACQGQCTSQRRRHHRVGTQSVPIVPEIIAS